MPRIDHLKNNPSKIPFPKQTRSSWSNASFHKSPIYYLSRSKINTLITARSIHPYTKTTFLRAVDKVTHHQTISINNQLDPPSTFLCSKKSEKEKKKKTVSRFDSPPFSSSNDPPTDSSIASKLFHPFPREAIDHKVTAASMTRTVLAFAIVQPATTHAIPSSYPRDRHILLPPSPSPFGARAAVARYIISQDPTFVCGEAGHVAQNRGCISRVAAACTGDACSGARVPAIGCTGRNALRGKSGE